VTEEPHRRTRRGESRPRRGDGDVRGRDQLTARGRGQTVHRRDHGDRQSTDQLHQRLTGVEYPAVMFRTRVRRHFFEVVTGGEDVAAACLGPENNGADRGVLAAMFRISGVRLRFQQCSGTVTFWYVYGCGSVPVPKYSETFRMQNTFFSYLELKFYLVNIISVRSTL
jgi:hypothetical protein